MSHYELDCTGLHCPEPILEAGKKLRSMDEGDTLSVGSDDPAFRIDLEAFADRMGYKILSFEEGPVCVVKLQK